MLGSLINKYLESINKPVNTGFTVSIGPDGEEYIDVWNVESVEQPSIAFLMGFQTAVDSDRLKASIRKQIADLEQLQTPRRIREALTTQEGANWMVDLEHQISLLRNQL